LDQVWVYGNNFELFLVAVVVPERQALEEWAAANYKAGGFSELCNDIKARGYILDELNKTGKKLWVSLYMIYHLLQTFMVHVQIFRTGKTVSAILCHDAVERFRDAEGSSSEASAIQHRKGPLSTPTFKLKRPQLLKYYKVRGKLFQLFV
jgi:long-subunit acyl-CoA synthetase (AMP-forming)